MGDEMAYAGGTAERLLDEAARQAEKQVAIVRIVCGLAFFLMVLWIAAIVPQDDRGTLYQLGVAALTTLAVTLVGIGSLVALRRGAGVIRVAYLTTTADVAIVLGSLAYTMFAANVSTGFFAVFPPVWLIPIILAATALRYRPPLQIYVTGLFVAGLVALTIGARPMAMAERSEALGGLALGFGVPPNLVRIAMITAAALTLYVVTRRGHRILHEAVRETTAHMNLTRFLPKELAPLLVDTDFAGLARGQRQAIVIVFVDMRGSTARAEHMEPEAFAAFMSAFRERIMKTAEDHGGVVDKFIGDGALVLFGAPRPEADDSERALAFARRVVAAVEEWSVEAKVDPPVKIGVGLHRDEVFCGVVGSRDRLEFTVLGDAVNVAARLEKTTKSFEQSILASTEVVVAAGCLEEWCAMGTVALEGRTGGLSVMAPRDKASSASPRLIDETISASP
ncbi:adenylate/guanylate cyclase domain-containing protein [Jiella marina]|uniref:adenylate/guanylate cyclase domain-containing protein n=1 Tax=Jiella sp. LLJ827 TaxID=2917712 RepID=UPI0021016DFD|nr:adenylate/guanylate cyclase domain-containing protein [Jiella sp. LLJ827]MCQ0988351.1 adenylate/guanylate cyclase domain-containing protein [Jiella sp. LLJ827]